jgi:hypothetical protein
MPVVPNVLERLVLLQLNQGPAPMLDFLGAQAFRTAAAALRLGVLNTLVDGSLTARELAARIEADERGTTLLLEALDSLGYVHKRGDRYSNSAMTAKWLPLLADGVPFMEHSVLHDWDDLEGAVRRGGPATTHYDARRDDPVWWSDFQHGMMAIARMTSESIVGKVKLPQTARRLLDVGGGHGLHAISFCRRYPKLAATVFDWPQALGVTREVIACEGMEGRVTTQAGDFYQDDLGSGYDAALVFNILHGYQPEQNVELLRKVAGALNPGGTVVVFDQVVGRAMGPTARALASLQGLNLFIGSGGRTYSFGEIGGWLDAAGFGKPRRIRLLKSPGFALVVAAKPA